ncbi:MAG: type III-B CRISPR module RAMP protein Cmr4 [Gammaproteobacteria bacterium]|nr:type III-B CRISPR module RAMP protein Cmr4 [Gammaproteobacteria bacterium]MBU1655811.1 type III-B CRISPR module RAMP protein Cmr4 [Gammaproteobacteria bacterium]MBU1960202.1 type III-B CRISPR module RAMP protein Cmr4 [Gammaproteobacteria bacterium]
MHANLYHLHALSALHCGIGQTVGIVDLPIARARATHLPIVPGSSLRGVLRASLEGSNEAAARTLFGPRAISGSEGAFAGALAVGDAHLLLLPVRALSGILCYVTAPFVLNRYAQDIARAGSAPPAKIKLNGQQARVTTGSVNLNRGKLVLEDLDLDAAPDPNLDAWARHIAEAVHAGDAAAQDDLIQRLALVPDDIFAFLAETATEIRTRIAIDPGTGTVKRGALWYEENLPAETVLWGIYALSPSNNKEDQGNAQALGQALPPSGVLLQLGGKAGVGRGLCRLLRQEVRHA